jgi:hypothetical protein
LEVDPVTNEPLGDKNGYHSMLLIGVLQQTVDGVTQYYVLCQNWYTGKYFLSMKVEYFTKCDPTILWVEKPVTEFSNLDAAYLNDYQVCRDLC